MQVIVPLTGHIVFVPVQVQTPFMPTGWQLTPGGHAFAHAPQLVGS